MCGPNTTLRPSSGGRIAVMFPSTQTKSMTPYTLFFHEGPGTSTKAIFRIEDTSTFNTFRGCERIDLRIERHGDLSSPLSSTPLHRFRLLPTGKSGGLEGVFEFELPERLDLGISEKGILGRQVTVVAEGKLSSIIGMGMGIVGYD